MLRASDGPAGRILLHEGPFDNRWFGWTADHAETLPCGWESLETSLVVAYCRGRLRPARIAQ